MSDESAEWWFHQQWSDFRRGDLELRMSWPGGGAHAVLFDRGVPRAARGLHDALPLEIELVHVAWSGEMLMATRTFAFGPDFAENDVRLVRPGDLTWDSKYGELGVVYGTAECRLPSGPNCVTVFGAVDEGLEQLAAFGRARRFEGRGTVRFEVMP
jgi:hypothetical protein